MRLLAFLWRQQRRISGFDKRLGKKRGLLKRLLDLSLWRLQGMKRQFIGMREQKPQQRGDSRRL